MIAASVLGLPAIFLLITVLPCIRMGHEPGAAKYRRSQLGGILIILLGKAPAVWGGLEPGPCSQMVQRALLEGFLQAGLALELSSMAAAYGWTKGRDRSGRTKTGGRVRGRAVNPSVFAFWSPWAQLLWGGHCTRAVPSGTGLAGSPWK